MQFNVKKLTKSRKHVRMAIFGPTGAGKTYTSLALARGLVDEDILVIDTERKTAGLYAEDLNYDGRIHVIDDLPNVSPETYTAALEHAAREGFKCVVIDSLSHAWEGTLEEVDKATQRSKSGNSFAGWKEVTPMHNKMVDTILRYPGHVIVTMRVKTEWLVETINGKSVPRKIGLQPRQKDGIEYEFDFTASMDQENNFVIDKTRATVFSGFVEKRPGADLAAKLRAWAEAGGEPDEAMSDPHLALKAFNVEQAAIQRLRERTKAKGHAFSEVVLSAWNAGNRGAAGLEDYIDKLPTKEPEPLQPNEGESVAKPEGNGSNAGDPPPPSEGEKIGGPTQPPTDDPPKRAEPSEGQEPKFGLDVNQKIVVGKICDQNGWKIEHVLQGCWDQGLRTYDEILGQMAEMASNETEEEAGGQGPGKKELVHAGSIAAQEPVAQAGRKARGGKQEEGPDKVNG